MTTAIASNRRFLSLVFFLLVCYAAAAAGGVATALGSGQWYQNLQKPSWTPPDWIFSPIWTVLYGTMAVAAWLVWDRRHGQAFSALKLFAYQLGLNVLWSILFFGMRSPDAAAANVLVLWLLIGATIVAFHRIHRAAGLLMMPYWLWITYASVLNYRIAEIN
jgi:translocator protein